MSRLLCSDRSVASVFMDIDDGEGYFGEVLKLGRGESVYIDENRCDLMRQIGVVLENDELCSVG